jgi:hypothetical protein
MVLFIEAGPNADKPQTPYQSCAFGFKFASANFQLINFHHAARKGLAPMLKTIKFAITFDIFGTCIAVYVTPEFIDVIVTISVISVQ